MSKDSNSRATTRPQKEKSAASGKHVTAPRQRELGRFFYRLGIKPPKDLHLFDAPRFFMPAREIQAISDEDQLYEVYRYGSHETGFVPVLEPRGAHK